MKLFKSKRREPDLGTGVWKRAVDRFERSLDRYHQVLDGIHDTEDYNHAVVIGNDLVTLAGHVKELAARAQEASPSSTMDVPGRLADVHRLLSRSSNSLATAVEALALYRLASEQGLLGEAAAHLDAVRFRVGIVKKEVAESELIFEAMS